MSNFRFSAFGKDAALGGGNGALKAGDADKFFVNAAANDGLAPEVTTEPRTAAIGNRAVDWTLVLLGTCRTTLGTERRCCSTICSCCGVTPAARIA